MMAMLGLSILILVQLMIQTMLLVTPMVPVSSDKTIQSLVPMLNLMAVPTLLFHATRTSMVATMVIFQAKMSQIVVLTVKIHLVTTKDLNFTG